MLTALANVLKARGYDPHIDGLGAWNYGVPQHRPRLFLVGTPKGVIFEWPSESSSHTPWQAIGDLSTVEASTKNEVRPYLGLPESERGQKLREASPIMRNPILSVGGIETPVAGIKRLTGK